MTCLFLKLDVGFQMPLILLIKTLMKNVHRQPFAHD